MTTSTLHKAASRVETSDINRIVSENLADLNTRDRIGQTPLIIAAARENLGAVVAFLERGADPNAKDVFGATAMHYAAGAGALRIVLELADHGADIEAKDLDGMTALDAAVSQDNLEVAETLRGLSRDRQNATNSLWLLSKAPPGPHESSASPKRRLSLVFRRKE